MVAEQAAIGLAGLAALRQMLDLAYREFRRNPSAANYVRLERTMLIYQDTIKNR